MNKVDKKRIENILGNNNINDQNLANAISQILDEFASDKSIIDQVKKSLDRDFQHNQRIHGHR